VKSAGQIPPNASQLAYVVVANVVDALGNSTADAGTASFVSAAANGPFTFGIDGLAPNVTITGVRDGATYGAPPNPAITITDNAGFSSVTLVAVVQVETAAGLFCAVTDATGAVTGFATTPSTSCAPLDASRFALPATAPKGEYTMQIQARDAAGNLSQAEVFKFSVQ
jgi:hypothetical protein